MAACLTTALAGLVPGAAQADVENAALCTVHAEVTLQAGAYTLSNAPMSCLGLVSGQGVLSPASVQLWGHYTTGDGPHGCTVSLRDGLFAARVPMAVHLIDNAPLLVEGGVTIGASGRVAGSGDSDGQPFLVNGGVSFTPDRSASCATLSGGALTMTLALSDGGDGNPAAAVAIGEHLDPTSTGSPSVSARPARHGHRLAHRSGRRLGHRRGDAQRHA